MAKPFLEPGPTPGTVINSPGELDALVASGQPGVDHGMVYRKATAPDIATYPIYGNFIWIDTSGPRPIKRTYNTTLFTWDAELPADGSITGDMLADGTITLSKIFPTAGLGGYVMRLNGASTAVVWDAPANLFSANTFAIANLTYSGAGTFVLSSNGSANAWATIPSLLATGDIALSKLSTTGAATNKVIHYNGSTLGYEYPDQLLRTNQVGLNALELGSNSAIPGISADGSQWQFYTPSQLANLLREQLQTSNTGEIAVPGAEGDAITPYAHGLGVAPGTVRWVFVCKITDAGYPVGYEVDVGWVTDQHGGDSNPCWVTMTNSTYLELRRASIGAGGTLCIPHYTTGVWNTAFTPGNWKLKCYFGL